MVSLKFQDPFEFVGAAKLNSAEKQLSRKMRQKEKKYLVE